MMSAKARIRNRSRATVANTAGRCTCDQVPNETSRPQVKRAAGYNAMTMQGDDAVPLRLITTAQHQRTNKHFSHCGC